MSRIPSTDSIHELAKFWDSHDLTDFEKELEEVKEPVFVRQTIQLRLPRREAAAVQRLAQAKGVTDQELIRGWVLQNLAQRNGKGRARRKAATPRSKK